jgi:hypothetical protein
MMTLRDRSAIDIDPVARQRNGHHHAVGAAHRHIFKANVGTAAGLLHQPVRLLAVLLGEDFAEMQA